MTKNLSSKPGYRGGNPKADKKLQPNPNATNHHSQNETVVANSTAVLITVQKASIDLKMLTPEQRRLANLMNDKVDVTEIEKKINKIMELTGASKDKAIVALHDCANELDKAIDMILEGDSINESEWKSQARKKKPKASKELEQNANSGKILNGDTKKGVQKAGGRQIRSKQQQTNNPSDKQNKFERAGNKKDRDQHPHWKQSKEPNNSVNDESTTQLINNKDVEQVDDKLDDWPDESPSTNNNSNNSSSTQRNRVINNNNNESQFKPSTHKFHQDRDQRRPSTGSRNYNSRNFGTSNDRNLNDRRNDRGQGDRMMDRRSYQNKSYTKKPGNFTNSIDTWSNYTVTDNNPSTNNDYAQMTVGNWSDVVSSTSTTAANVQQNKNEDLNENNEWTESSTTTNLVDQLKNNQTANKPDHHNLPKMPNLASIVSGVKPQQPVQQQTVHHKSPNVKQQQQPQQSINLSNSNNHQLSASQQHPLTKSPQQQRQPPQQTSSTTTNQPNKIDLAALLKSSSTNQPPQPQQPQSTNEQQMNKLIRGNIQQQQQQQRSSNSDTNTYGAALLQRLQQGANNLSEYVNSYSTSNSQQLSSQNKNLVHHIPSSNYNSQNNPTSALFDNQSHHNQLQHQQQTTSLEHQKSLIEKKRRQTKIPETAVEMPSSDHISSLNVQFGALDFVGSATNTAAADSYLNDHQSNNNEKSANNSTPANSLLSTVRGNDNKQNISDHHQQLQDNILHAAADNRNKQQVQQQQTGYQQHINNSYKSENTSSIYPSNLQGYQSSYSVNNYSSQNHQQQNNQSMSSSNQQKINLKDLDTTSSTANSEKQNPVNNASSNSLGNLVNNTTVTTNVLKNSLTATGKTQANMQQQLNVPPNVAPLLGTPQYIMSQPGLSTAFYPVYDMPMAPATDHSFRGYNQNTGPQDVKYTRSDNQDGQTNHSVNPGVGQSNQAPVTQTPNHQIFSHIPPYFFYTGMMTQGLQGLYQTPAPIFPVQPNAGNPQAPHANSNHSTAGFNGPKSAQNQAAPYSTASAYSTSTSYDPMTGQLTNQGAQDYNKPQNYTSGPNNSNQQTVKQMSNTGSNDLVNNNMYTKSHAQLTKNFDKSGTFQSGTPPPFGIAALGYNPNQFIPMMQPQSTPSMLHHSLQGDGSNHNQNNSGVGGNNQRGGSLSQKNTTSNANKYYNWS